MSKYPELNPVEELAKIIEKLTKENESLKSLNDFYIQKIEVLENKLEKVEEIANKSCTSGCRCIDKTDILQVINKEAKNNERSKRHL